MQAANRVVKNTGILYTKMVITVFVSLYATRLVLAGLGASDFGVFSLVGGAISMLTFLNSAMASASQRFMSYAQGAGNVHQLRSIFSVSVVLHLIIAIIVVILLEVAGYFLFNGILRIPNDRLAVARLIYQFLVISTFFTVISVPYDAIINAHENMLFVAIMGMIQVFGRFGIAVLISNLSADRLVFYGLLMAVLTILLMVFQAIYCNLKYEEPHFHIKQFFDRNIFRKMTGFAGWSFLGTSSTMIANYGQGIVLNMFFGTIVNAAQGVALQISGQLGAFANTMMKALNPLIAKSEGAGNRQLMLKASLFGSKVSFFLLMFFHIPMLIEMPYIFDLWLKETPQYAVIFCRLVLLRNLIEQLFFTLSTSIAAVGNIRNYEISTSLLAFVTLFGSFLLFKLGFPPYTLYIVFLIYALITSGLIFYFASVNCNLNVLLFLKQVVFRCIGTFILVFGLVSLPNLMMDSGINRLVIVCATSISAFLILVWVLGFTKEEKSGLLVFSEQIFRKFRATIKN